MERMWRGGSARSVLGLWSAESQPLLSVHRVISLSKIFAPTGSAQMSLVNSTRSAWSYGRNFMVTAGSVSISLSIKWNKSIVTIS